MVTGSTGLLGAADGSYVLKRENVGDKGSQAVYQRKGCRGTNSEYPQGRRNKRMDIYFQRYADCQFVKKSEAFSLLMNYLTAEKRILRNSK